jgi:hypothetical protein
VGTRPLLSTWASNSFDFAVNQRNDFPGRHVIVNAPYHLF